MIVARSSAGLRAIVIFAALAAAFGCGKKEGGAAPGGGMPPPPPVSVAEVINRDVHESEEFSGRLEAVERVDVRPRVAGYIQSIHFAEGKEVNKGDLLAVIDPRPFEAELKRAQAQLVSAESQAKLAQLRLQRSENLVRDKFLAQQSLDERSSEARAAQAQVDASRAAVEAARLNVEFSRIRAPISGRIGRAEVTVGNAVDAGPPSGTLLTTIVSLDPIYAYFEGDEQVYLKYAALARSGPTNEARTPIFMGLANETGFPHEGQMNFVDNQLDPKTGTIRVRAVFSNKDRLFTPGLFARLKLVGAGTYNAMLINDRAVGTDQSQKFVLVIGAGNNAEYRPVKLGPMVDGLRVVKEGLKAGEIIVVNGLQRVRPGMPVTPQKVAMEGDGNPPAPAAAPAKKQ